MPTLGLALLCLLLQESAWIPRARSPSRIERSRTRIPVGLRSLMCEKHVCVSLAFRVWVASQELDCYASQGPAPAFGFRWYVILPQWKNISPFEFYIADMLKEDMNGTFNHDNDVVLASTYLRHLVVCRFATRQASCSGFFHSSIIKAESFSANYTFILIVK